MDLSGNEWTTLLFLLFLLGALLVHALVNGGGNGV